VVWQKIQHLSFAYSFLGLCAEFGYRLFLTLPLCSGGWRQNMQIRFTDKYGQTQNIEVSQDYKQDIVVDVTREIGEFYQESYRQERSNDRKNTRRERHTSLDTFEYEDARYFSAKDDPYEEIYQKEFQAFVLSKLTPDQVRRVRKVIFEGWTYVDLANDEGVDECFR